MKATDPLKPSPQLLIKLGSVIVHQGEKLSAGAHWMDDYALNTVREDPEVVQWLEAMKKMALLPVKR